ncbi:MAG TPA: PKD-like family lipoprotein [Puia sp.]|nr:PKD-like family lipoprotein [Puia sp.]
MNAISKISTLVTGTLLLLCFSCRKYQVISDTKKVNEVKVGLQANYIAYLGDTLHVVPNLSFTQDNSGDSGRYKYQWYVINLSEDGLSGTYKVPLDSTIDLTYKISLSPGNYILYFDVTDTVTGVLFHGSAPLKVTTPYYEGWLVLSDAGSAPRLDMVSYDDNFVGTLHFDVLGKLNSDLKLTGEAKNVLYHGSVYITTTGNGTNAVDPDNFSWKSTNNIRYDMLDPSIPLDFYADRFVVGGYQGQALYSNGNVYTSYGPFFGLPINRMKGETTNFYAEPSVTVGFYIYLYDQAKHRFAANFLIANNTSCDPLPAFGTSGAMLFDWNNTGMNLVYMDESEYNGKEVFAILKDTVTGKFHLALFNDYGQTQDYYAEMTGTDLASATHFSINNNYGYVFYSAGSKLYEFDLGLKTSKLMADYSPLQITNVIRNPVASQTNDLLVTLLDPSGTAGSNGILKIYSVPPVGGSLVLHETYTGFGDIKGVTYRQR